MNNAYIIEHRNIMAFCEEEAAHLAEGTPIITGTFKETASAWTGIFTADDGQVYEINEGYIKKGAA